MKKSKISKILNKGGEVSVSYRKGERGRRHRREEGERGRWREDEGGREGEEWVKERERDMRRNRYRRKIE